MTDRLDRETVDLLKRSNPWLARALSDLLAEREALEAQNRDLLEALVWAMSEIHGSTRYDDQSQFENCCDKARAAIAKARGEA